MIKFRDIWLQEFEKGFWYIDLGEKLTISLPWRRAARLYLQMLLMFPLFLTYSLSVALFTGRKDDN